MIQAMTRSYLLEREQGVHVWGVDVMMLSLYTGTLDPDTLAAYTAVNEVVGAGYAAGGVALALSAGFPMLSPSGVRKVLWDFADVVFNPASFTWRSGLIYNASKANRSVAVLDFGQDQIATVNATIVWPDPSDNLAIIRSGA
jgi:hypothetical protein